MKWKRKLEISNEQIKQLADEININELLAKIILNREFTTEQAKVLINDWEQAIINPELLTNAKEAAKEISKYCDNPDATIYIFGDYDLDGMTSLYILTTALNEVAKCKIVPYIPNRHEGYGLNMDWAEKVVNKHTDELLGFCGEDVLVITVDNGITQVEQINHLIDNGINVIVTDHHVAKGQTPNCLIVDPHNHNEPDTFKHLAGCGVAFKVAQLVQEEFNVFNMMNYTPYLALGTIADMMPLTSENIAFIQYGLHIINSDNCPKGLKRLKEFIGKDQLSYNDVAWELSPRFNSCGRLGKSEVGVRLFFEQDDDHINDLVNEIEILNTERKSYSDKAKKLLNELNFDNDEVCIINATSYPEGVVGIIAGEAQKKFNKPSIVVVEKNGKLVGSARSVNGINLQKVFGEEQSKGTVADFGGHEVAAGVTIEKHKLDELRESLNDVISNITMDMPTPTEEELLIDELINIGHINENTYNLINQIPYDNRTLLIPTFALVDVEVVSWTTSKNNPNNICFTLKDEHNGKTQLWAWGMTEQYVKLGEPKRLHIAGNIERNFMRPKTFTLKVKDFMEA